MKRRLQDARVPGMLLRLDSLVRDFGPGDGTLRAWTTFVDGDGDDRGARL